MKRLPKRSIVIGAIFFTVLVALAVSPWISDAPDGLTRVARGQGIDAEEQEHLLEDGPLADYSVDGVGGDRLSKGSAVLIGMTLTFVGSLVAFRFARRTRSSEVDES